MPMDLYLIFLLFRELLNISKLQSKQSMNEILGIFPDMSDGGLSTSVANFKHFLSFDPLGISQLGEGNNSHFKRIVGI